ncbi:unnamed protein product [Symbiodinium sp. CCMP2592]|nr:unnamed protein product [Symbiodinium sp. CCMP2592]
MKLGWIQLGAGLWRFPEAACSCRLMSNAVASPQLSAAYTNQRRQESGTGYLERRIQKANTSHCAARKLPGPKEYLRRDLPLDAWPADVVCHAGITDLLVDLHVILLVWEKIGRLDVSDIPLNVSVIHTPRTRKIDAWLLHLTSTAVAAYDYVWLADGDVKTSDVNWFAFWTNMLLSWYFQPQVAQPAIVAFDKGKVHWRHWRKSAIVKKFHRSTQTRGSDHTVLQIPEDDEDDVWAIDPTLIAAEVGIVEIMTPVLTPRAWLAMREALVSNSKAMQWITQGATWCVDVKWCQLARTSVLGLEVAGEPDVGIGALAQRFIQQQSSHFRWLWPTGERHWDSYLDFKKQMERLFMRDSEGPLCVITIFSH